MVAVDFLNAFVANSDDEDFQGRQMLRANVKEAVVVLLPLLVLSDEELDVLGVG